MRDPLPGGGRAERDRPQSAGQQGTRPQNGRLAVGVIGAGKVGPVLGAALAGAGHEIVGITSGSHPDRVDAMLPGVAVLGADHVARLSELVIVAVPRDELAALAAGLADVGAWRAGQLVLHTDASHGLGVLEPASRLGAIALAVHPAIAFTGTSLDVRQLGAAYAGVTAPPAVLPIAQALAVEMGMEPVVIRDEDRPVYADAIDTAVSFSAQIVAQASGMLGDIGIPDPGGYLSTLVRSSVDRALSSGAPAVPDEPPRL